jgi:hypothetical protein
MRSPRLLTTADVEENSWLLEEADGLTQLLYVQHGVLGHGQALQHMSRSAVEHRLATQEWRGIHRGVYVVGMGPLRQAQRRWLAILAAGDGAVLAGRTALEQHGLRHFSSELVHVLTPGRRRVIVPPQGVLVHRTSAPL